MAELSREHVLIAGVTTRPFAVSAARAGYRVTAIDAFGDVDLRAVAEVILAPSNPGRRNGTTAAVAAGALVKAELAAYTSSFENYPRAVTSLSVGRRLLGNTPVTLARVRDPIELMNVLRRNGLVAPETRSRLPEGNPWDGPWLLKPRRSGGGHGIRRWFPGIPVPRSMYLQQRIAGTPGSISFVADGTAAVVLGFSRQLVGDPHVGAQRYRYCGSILGNRQAHLFRQQEKLLERASEVATVVTREFQLVGLNGIDFIARQGVPFPIEVNPRFSSSMELIERAHGVSMFEVHAQACQGVLPKAPPANLRVEGKAIVFARRATTVREISWADQKWVADVPHPGEAIQQGRPICTVFAAARHPEACRRLLRRRAAAVYRAVKSPRTQAA